MILFFWYFFLCFFSFCLKAIRVPKSASLVGKQFPSTCLAQEKSVAYASLLPFYTQISFSSSCNSVPRLSRTGLCTKSHVHRLHWALKRLGGCSELFHSLHYPVPAHHCRSHRTSYSANPVFCNERVMYSLFVRLEPEGTKYPHLDTIVQPKPRLPHKAFLCFRYNLQSKQVTFNLCIFYIYPRL